jgi:hypothetical protein
VSVAGHHCPRNAPPIADLASEPLGIP